MKGCEIMFPWSMFPFINKDMKDTLQKIKPEQIDSYVQDMLGKIMPGNMRGMMNPQDMFKGFQSPVSQEQSTSEILNSTAFETHDFVFIRIPIKKEEWIKQLRVYHTSNQLIVEHIPQHDDKHTITLPAIVKKKGASANFKDGVLEIKIPKNIDMQYSQIDVTEMI
jgi:HSP20 family molecular chaperone IbpA